MKNICVITGGGSGMGLECAKIIGLEQRILLVGRTASKLEGAIEELKGMGIEVEAYPCDVSNREHVQTLAAHAAAMGAVKTVIHAAGISPHMATADKIFEINAMGTLYMDEAFSAVMGDGSCILNVSSMSAYMLPADRAPKQVYRLALTDTVAFQSAMSQLLAAAPEAQRRGMAYTISKHFIIWYTARKAVKLGREGMRVISISPGTFQTPMGEIEGEAAAGYARDGALGRLGRPEEIAKMMAFMVSDACSYLCGVDILYDGGAIAAMRANAEDGGAIAAMRANAEDGG